MTVPKPARGACRWMPAVEHLYHTGTGSIRDTVVCCSCRTSIPHTSSWAAVPYGRNEIRLPLPVFLFCQACRLGKDATEEWVRANQKAATLR